MKITKTQLKQLIREQLDEMCAGAMDHPPEEPEVMVVGDEGPQDIAGIASAAIAAIYELATAAGADMSVDVGAEEEVVEEYP